jgi:circadian clock protein KaiB
MTEPESMRPNIHLVPDDKASGTDTPSDHYRLRLYIAGQTSKSLAAIANLKKICDQHLEGRCSIEVIDLMEQPHLAAGDQIVAVPTLVRRLPPPLKRIVGTLSDMDRVLVGLDLKGEPGER